MKIETKVTIYSSLFYGLFFGVVFTIVGGLIAGGAVDWPNFPITVLVGVVVGLVVGLIVPMGKWGLILASKVAKPGTFIFNLILYSVILVIMLLVMCPVFTIFIGSYLHSAPIAVILPSSFDLFIPFYLVGIALLLIFGNTIMNLAKKCAGVPREDSTERGSQ